MWWSLVACTLWAPQTPEAFTITLAPVTSAPRGVPLRFTALLATPPAARGSDVEQYPPVGFLLDRMCTGEGDARQQVVEAITNTVPADRAAWDELLLDWGCREPDHCAWRRAQVRALAPELAASFWTGIEACGDSETRALVAARAPDAAFFAYFATHPVPFEPAVEARTERALAARSRHAGIGLYALAASHEDAAGAALLRLHAAAPRDQRDEVAVQLWGRSDRTSIALHTEACARLRGPFCGRTRPDPLVDPIGAMRAGRSPSELLTQYPGHRAMWLDAFESCAAADALDEDGEYAYFGELPARCLASLASQDRARARALEPRLPSNDEALREVSASVSFDDTAALAARLEELGFVVLTDPAEALTAFELLQASGDAMSVDVASDGDPSDPHHDLQLYRLARFAGLPEVLFDELVPLAEPEAYGRQPRVVLYAWRDDVRVRTLVDPSMPAVWAYVGLLNALLERRGDAHRLAIDARFTRLVRGTPVALGALSNSGLLPLADGHAWDVTIE